MQLSPTSGARSPAFERFMTFTREHRQVIREALAQHPFELQASDVFVATFPKCGTTWAQHIVHGVRTGGSMDFDEISRVVPFFEIGLHFGTAGAPQVAQPRAFKTHLSWDLVPKGARYVYVLRHPGDALVSWYHYVNGALFERDAVSLDEFAREVFLADDGTQWGSYWNHLRSWWPQHDEAYCLFLCYEDMAVDVRDAVERIWRFLGMHDDCGALDRVAAQSTFTFMKSHAEKFDGVPRLPVSSGVDEGGADVPTIWRKMREGRSGGHLHALSDDIREALAGTWKRQIEATLGFASYDRLRQHLLEVGRARWPRAS